jgi:hypothetical protein
MNKYLCLITTIFIFSFNSWTTEVEDVQMFLKEFHSNPKQAMDRLPQQIINGQAIERGFVDYNILKSSAFNVLAPPARNDLASSIVDGGRVNSNINSLEQLGLMSSSLSITPWADSYWPTHKGLIGIRYGDLQFPNSRSFRVNYDYISSHPASGLVAAGSSFLIDQLSPAEKYDLLVGDSTWTMTKYSWQQGLNYLARGQRVPGWVGICHGWSAAAHMGMPVTSSPIIVSSVNNIKITFFPSDIKALQSMLWANASPRTRFVGSRCNVFNPARNKNGRIIDPACFNNNPATFHLILTNQLGLNHRSFIIDATYDAEVWNFPLSSYRYHYFNPQSLVSVSDFRQAVIPIDSFTIDKFKEFRSPQARYIVGIALDDTYVVEIAPNRGAQLVSPVKTIRHIYDLELDANYEIIGGEWYANAHPDFIWTFDVNAMARSISESSVKPSDWGLHSSVPQEWTQAAQLASAKGQPILGIIQALLAHGTP